MTNWLTSAVQWWSDNGRSYTPNWVGAPCDEKLNYGAIPLRPFLIEKNNQEHGWAIIANNKDVVAVDGSWKSWVMGKGANLSFCSRFLSLSSLRPFFGEGEESASIQLLLIFTLRLIWLHWNSTKVFRGDQPKYGKERLDICWTKSSSGFKWRLV